MRKKPTALGRRRVKLLSEALVLLEALDQSISSSIMMEEKTRRRASLSILLGAAHKILLEWYLEEQKALQPGSSKPVTGE